MRGVGEIVAGTRLRPRPGRLLLAAALLLPVAACGFRLQGHTDLPPELRTPYIETQDRQSEFVQSLGHVLRISGAHPVNDAAGASAVLSISRDQFARRVLAVTANNQPTEYELTYTVRFSVSTGGRELLATQELSSTRAYSFDERLLLAKSHEESVLRQDMARDLADRVMRRISHL